jgi:hypothetical protein
MVAANSRRTETWHFVSPGHCTDSWALYQTVRALPIACRARHALTHFIASACARCGGGGYQDRQRFRETRAIQEVDVYRLIARLRIRTNIPEREVLAIYHDFERSINNEEQLLEVGHGPCSTLHSGIALLTAGVWRASFSLTYQRTRAGSSPWASAYCIRLDRYGARRPRCLTASPSSRCARLRARAIAAASVGVFGLTLPRLVAGG